MSVELVDLVGKMVTLTVASDNGGDNESYEARLEQVTEFAAVVRPKGQRGAGALKLVKPELIIAVEPIMEQPRQIKAKRLKPIDEAGARRHLLDAHFYTLEQVNGMHDAEALEVHNKIDHEGYGHTHDRGSDRNSGHREPCIGGNICQADKCPPMGQSFGADEDDLESDDDFDSNDYL